MTQFAYISANCGNLAFYFAEGREYDHPFIGMLFVNDKDFVKLCTNFDYYICLIPRLGLPSETSLWARQNGSPWYKHVEITPPYPVVYLDDLELHYIHEQDGPTLIEKFRRRAKRFLTDKPTPIFLWSCCEMMNDRSYEDLSSIVNQYLMIPNAVYVTKYPEISCKAYLYDEWVGADDKRNSSHIPEIHFIGDRVGEYKKIVSAMKNM